ncbi:MAG: ion channel [Actinomycetota bacterium]|nr:ion channel [Actinomycetota bacterium]
MPFFLSKVSRLVRARLSGWRLPLAIALFVFVTSWAAMALVEGSGEIVRPSTYWWYFVVTAATVGYGDVFPSSLGGRVVGAYVIIGGIVTLSVLFTQLSESLATARGKRMKGSARLDLQDHVVLLGYSVGRTERIVAELTAEAGRHVVLCAWEDVGDHPIPEDPAVHFVRGDLTHADVMARACVGRARTAVLDGRDDNETLAIAVAVDHAHPEIHMVAALRDLSRREHLGYVNPRVQCVQWHMPYLLSEEAVDPGITQVYNDLMSSGGHGNTYSLVVPPGFAQGTVGEVQTWLGRTYAATLLAVRTGGALTVSPPWDRRVEQGSTLYYVAAERLDLSRLSRG